MKISSSSFNSPNFHAGLTKQLKSEINHCEIKKISDEFSRNGVKTDFKNNKIVAWCSLKSLQLFKELKLPLPKGVYVEDFNLLDINDRDCLGFCNLAPTRLYLDKDAIIPEKTIFFNEFKELNHANGNEFWDEIDTVSDKQYSTRFAPTDHFLDTFIHEFSHSAHEENLIRNLGGKKTLEFFNKISNNSYLINYWKLYANMFKSLGDYAILSPPEAVASDMTFRIIQNTDDALGLTQNFIKKSPYRNLKLAERIFGLERKATPENILRKIWFGKDV